MIAIRHCILISYLACLPPAFGSLLPITVDIHDTARLQRGAKLYMNYCAGCHSLRYLRYSRMGYDLGLLTPEGQLDEPLLMNNLVFTQAKPSDPIEISMRPSDARQWFGQVPPDLSLIATVHGASWLYTYLKSFYADPHRPFGANNALVPDTAMPNVLFNLQGSVVAVKNTLPLQLRLVNNGEMSPSEFDALIKDLVTFLDYVADPSQLVRYRIGVGVIAFFSVLGILLFRLKMHYWRKIH